MHLLREGQFGVASTFITEANTRPPQTRSLPKARTWHGADAEMLMEDEDSTQNSTPNGVHPELMEGLEVEGQPGANQDPSDLQHEFSDMYRILHALRTERSLQPAMEWAKSHSDALEARGSNFEFELCRLRFIELYHANRDEHSTDGHSFDLSGPLKAIEYARTTFPALSSRHLRETSSLLGSLAFAPAIQQSPYQTVFFDDNAWEDVASSFVREFCAMLGLSEKSPLHTAVTAGGIALPVLEKLERVMGEVGGQWTSANELPVRHLNCDLTLDYTDPLVLQVEIPLPPSYLFHSIFVCPVSKEQATDTNPPMMMPCGHVVAKESLEKISRGGK